MWHICASATDDVLTTTSYVKNLLGTSATSDDATLSALIRAASRWAETYVGYPLVRQAYQETVAGFRRRHLMLRYTPIVAVPRLYDSTDTGTDGGDQILTTEFRVEDRDAGFLSRDDGFEWTVPIEFELTARPLAGSEYKPWLVDYMAGYTYAGLETGSALRSTVHGTTSTGRTLPEDIEHAVALRTISMYQGALSASADVTKEKVGDLEVSYGSASGTRVAKTVEEILLDPYRRLV